MIFQPELARLVLEGRKTVTRRLCSENPRSPWWRERCVYVEGKVFAVQPGRGKPSIGRARVVSCRKELLGLLTHEDAEQEGFADISEFMGAWRAINGRYLTHAMVWRIEFEVCS
jgi:hypothetical protein